MLRKIALIAGVALSALMSPSSPAAENDELIWPRIVSGMRLVDSEQPETVQWARWYARYPDHFYNLLARSEPFLWYIVEAVELRDMPLEIALLPAIESGFDPRAKSAASARGLWQFVPATGARFGLRDSATYDANIDPIASTRAAMKYILALNQDFGGDWMLTLAAYNVGEGRIKQELRKQTNPDARFWDLSLPPETREHVPRLLGLALLIKEPRRFGVKLPPLLNHHVAELVPLNGARDVEAAAYSAGISADMVRQYNPGLKTLSNSRGKSALLLPPTEAMALREELARFDYPAKPLRKSATLPGRLHQVAAGDTLSRLARLYGVSIEQLRDWNALERDQSLRIGRRLRVGPLS